jgi:hypothetical protein
MVNFNVIGVVLTSAVCATFTMHRITWVVGIAFILVTVLHAGNYAVASGIYRNRIVIHVIPYTLIWVVATSAISGCVEKYIHSFMPGISIA